MSDWGSVYTRKQDEAFLIGACSFKQRADAMWNQSDMKLKWYLVKRGYNQYMQMITSKVHRRCLLRLDRKHMRGAELPWLQSLLHFTSLQFVLWGVVSTFIGIFPGGHSLCSLILNSVMVTENQWKNLEKFAPLAVSFTTTFNWQPMNLKIGPFGRI